MQCAKAGCQSKVTVNGMVYCSKEHAPYGNYFDDSRKSGYAKTVDSFSTKGGGPSRKRGIELNMNKEEHFKEQDTEPHSPLLKEQEKPSVQESTTEISPIVGELKDHKAEQDGQEITKPTLMITQEGGIVEIDKRYVLKPEKERSATIPHKGSFISLEDLQKEKQASMNLINGSSMQLFKQMQAFEGVQVDQEDAVSKVAMICNCAKNLCNLLKLKSEIMRGK